MLLINLYTFLQPGTSLQVVLHQRAFPELRLAVFVNRQNSTGSQGFIIAEQKVLFEITPFDCFRRHHIFNFFLLCFLCEISKVCASTELSFVCSGSFVR